MHVLQELSSQIIIILKHQINQSNALVILRLFNAIVSKCVNLHKKLKNIRAMNELLVTQMFYPTILLIKRKKKLLPLEIVRAGLHWDLRISRQILPLLLMFGWYILVVKDTCEDKTMQQAHSLQQT